MKKKKKETLREAITIIFGEEIVKLNGDRRPVSDMSDDELVSFTKGLFDKTLYINDEQAERLKKFI